MAWDGTGWDGMGWDDAGMMMVMMMMMMMMVMTVGGQGSPLLYIITTDRPLQRLLLVTWQPHHLIMDVGLLEVL